MSIEIPEVNPEIPPHAVSVYSSDPSEEFPVLKAFQQYVDAEQSKARKRMLILCIFFATLMTLVVGVFIFLLTSASERNQQLNDRLIEFVMKDQNRQAAVVVQPPTDNTMLMLLSKIEDLQKKMEAASQKAAEDAAAVRREVAERSAKELEEKAAAQKGPSPEELEIVRLKALLAVERKKADAERARKHQEEIEAYRRKYYPELYEDETSDSRTIDSVLEEFEADDAIDYFSSEESPRTNLSAQRATKSPSRRRVKKNTEPVYTIPVEANGSKREWRIPE